MSLTYNELCVRMLTYMRTHSSSKLTHTRIHIRAHITHTFYKKNLLFSLFYTTVSVDLKVLIESFGGGDLVN